MLFGVSCDVDVVEASICHMEPDFFGLVGMHPLDEFLPFLIVTRKAVVLVDDNELPAWFECLFRLTETMLDVGPEIDGLKGCDEVEGVLLERQLSHVGLPHLATAFGDGLGVHLLGFRHRDRRIVNALHHAFRDALQQPCDVGATAAADVQDMAVLFDLYRRQGPVGHGRVTAAIHSVDHHFTEEALRLARIAEDFA